MIRTTARLLAVVFVLLTIVVAAPARGLAQPKEVVIGVLYPMTGPNAQPGIDNKPVIEIGADIANGAADLPFPFYQRLKGMELAQRIVALQMGQVIADGPPATIVRDARVIDAYLGSSWRPAASGTEPTR